MDADILAVLPIWFVVFLLSVTCHEAAHALAAKWGGDLTAYHAGQVTLNPAPHVQREPWGMVVMPLLSLFMSRGSMLMGWGSAPYDPYWEQRYPRRAAWMALAGPAANVALAIISGILIRVGMSTGLFVEGSGSIVSLIGSNAGGLWDGAARFLGLMFCENILLACFNMLPVPPLDGNSAITLILPQRLAEQFRDFSRQGFLAMFGIWIAWFLASPIIWTALSFCVSVLLPKAAR
jgi:Zn-dependent protease